MNTYYLMNTEQKDAAGSALFQEPYSNIAVDKWIVECIASGLDCITEYASSEDCKKYVVENLKDWEELYSCLI